MIDMKFLQVPAMFNTVMLDVVWIIVGLIAFYAGIKNLMDKENPSRIGTAIFWCSFGVVTALGSWLPPQGFRRAGHCDVHARHLQEGEEGCRLCCYQG